MVMPINAHHSALCVCVCTYLSYFLSNLSSKIDGEDGGGLGGPVGVVMVVMVSPLLLLPSEQILVAERNTAVILRRESWTRQE